ncbi:MAG: FAD-dependent oxidoreductase, partial [Pseudomonadota bacterium]
GPTGGRLVRPSDEKQPQKVAWVQCVGSRNINQADAPYCSSVCCMIALKEAIVTKERFQDDIEAVIFYMDMRTTGKDYELYLERAKKDYHVRLVRCRPHTIDKEPDSDDLSITYLTDQGGEFIKETFDMVVLSTGFRVPGDAVELARRLGVEINDQGFVKSRPFNPAATSQPGIYVCGMLESPKDIPETMVQASAAAGMAAGLVGLGQGVRPAEEDEFEIGEAAYVFPPEREVSQEEPRIGVFVCDCGYNIGGVIDTQEVVDYAGRLPDVIISEMTGHGCSRESLRHLEDMIVEKRLNRVVVGGCSPRTHETRFQDTVRRAGLNKYLVEMANLRDQDTWVHMDNPPEASAKAKDLIRMAVASARYRHPLVENTLPVNKDVLVVGGGVAGMSAALSLADDGFKIYLVEKESKLGGLAKKIRKTLEGDDVQAFVQDLIARTTAHDNVQVLTDTLIVDHSGMPGLFRTGLQRGPQMTYRQINHGVTILATGALANRPGEYFLDEHEKVMTQLDLDALIEDDPARIKKWGNVIMIQCVGSRVPENPNCSRLCCQAAVKNALRILDLNPEARIFILNRDIRTTGFQENYYRLARERGVIFARYSLENKPLVELADGRLSVSFRDDILERNVLVETDCLALSTGLIADDEGAEDLAAIFHLPRTLDGYFLEQHVKLEPVDLPVRGFLVAGTAHSPKGVKESVGQGLAAAGRAKAMLAKDQINLGAAVAKVESQKCAACLICVRACPFAVPFIN